MIDFDATTKEELVVLLQQALVTIQSQQERIASLEQEIARIKGGDPPTKPKPTLPAFVKTNAQKRPQTPRKKRANSFVRPRRAPTQVVEHFPENCSCCGRKLDGGWLHRVREVIELPETPVQVIHHHLFARHCGVCQRREVASPDLSAEVVGQSRLGVRLMSLIATLDIEARLPVRIIQQLLQTLYQVPLSLGQIWHVLQKVAAKGQSAYEKLLEQLRQSPVVNADETGWRENGQNGYARSFSTPTLPYFLCQRSRSGSVVKEVLDCSFRGVLVSDFYGAYHFYTGPYQYCWPHLLRDLHALGEQHPTDAQVASFQREVRLIYDQAKLYTHPNRYERGRKRREFQADLSAVARQHTGEARPERVLAERILARIQGLFVFVEYPAVPSHNNAAERSVRPLVVLRKMSGGTRSSTGSETLAVLMSLFMTWRARKQNGFEACQRLLTAKPETMTA